MIWIRLLPTQTGTFLNLAETRLIVDNWHKVELTITNAGDAHVSDVRLTFTDDFDTRWITPVSVKAKESVTLDIGIKPSLMEKSLLKFLCPIRITTGKKSIRKFPNSGSM